MTAAVFAVPLEEKLAAAELDRSGMSVVWLLEVTALDEELVAVFDAEERVRSVVERREFS